MNEENKRKAIILTFIGALTLLFVVVGGTFAFFQIVNSNEGETSSTLTGETEGLTKYGTPTLTQGTSNLHINLKASDMGYSKKGTEYWATNVEENDYETEEQQYVISTAKISGAESEDTELSCTSELTIKASGSILEDTNPLVEEDGYVYLGSSNVGSNKITINPTQIDLKQIIDKSLNEGAGYQTEVNYTIKGNSSIDITVDIDIINRDANQNSLAGKSINFTITNKNISCSVTEKEDKAYMKNINDVLFTADMSGMGGSKCPYENIYFVDNIPERESIENIGTIDFVDLSDTESGTPEGSVVVWSTKKDHKVKKFSYAVGESTDNVDAEDLYIGSKSEIYATDLNNFFGRMYNLKTIDFSNLNTSETIDMSSMFQGSINLLDLDLSSFDTSKVIYMGGMFSPGDLSSGFKSKITFPQGFGSAAISMSGMFDGYEGATLDLSSFDTSSVTNMSFMFHRYKGTNIDLSSFDTSKVIDMSYMFAYTSVELSFNDWSNFVTTSVENMSDMFSEYGGDSLDLSTFDTSSVTNMSRMFSYYQGEKLDLSTFDTSQVTDMYAMFNGCNNLTELNLSNFTFDNVQDVLYYEYGDTYSGFEYTFNEVPESCVVKIKRSQQQLFEDKFPLSTEEYDGNREFTPSYVD